MIGIVLRRVFGAFTLLVGLAIIAWFVYNQFRPTPDFDRSFRSVLALAVPLAFVAFGWKWLRYQGRGIEEVFPPEWTGPELLSSVAEAKRTLPGFLAEVEKGIDGAFVKFPIETPAGLQEHIWGYVHFFRDDRFNVTLANQPFDSEEQAEGRRDVALEAVEDWQIVNPDGTIRGGYSIIALFRSREGQGKPLSLLMKKQRALLLDA